MSSYGQFCPVAKAMDLLDERWTLLVIRELLSGSTRFNELRRGVPRMSPALLTKRLRSLERADVVRRVGTGSATRYELSASGEDLRDIVEALGSWGVRWIGDLGDEDLDPHLLMWDLRRTIAIDAWPRTRTVVEFAFSGVAPGDSHWWLVVNAGEADVCDVDPGFEVVATVGTSLRTLTRVWRGDLSWSRALRTGEIEISGPLPVRRALPGWLGQSTFAAVPRPA